MSFFDEADEPPRTEIRTPSRPSSRQRHSGGSGTGGRRRPPSGPTHQSILVRRAIAVVALVVVIVLIAVGINSCQSSARRSALQDYANNVNSLVQRSWHTSNSLFQALQGGGGNASQTSQSINNTRAAAQSVLSDAQRLSAPSAARAANDHLLLALRMRLDAITNIAAEIQPALGSSVNQSAVKQIAAQMARFYASDVLYKSYAAPSLVSALHASDIPVGGDNGAPINPHQFLPSLNWLAPSYVGSVLGVSLSGSGSGSGGKVTGLHGHSLTSVSVGGSQLTPGAANTVPASPTPTFSLSYSNGGDFNETDVTCKVTVAGTSVSGTKVIPETYAGKSGTCQVTLSSAPPKGTHNVVATIEKVPGEKNTSNNTLSFPVTFN